MISSLEIVIVVFITLLVINQVYLVNRSESYKRELEITKAQYQSSLKHGEDLAADINVLEDNVYRLKEPYRTRLERMLTTTTAIYRDTNMPPVVREKARMFANEVHNFKQRFEERQTVTTTLSKVFDNFDRIHADIIAIANTVEPN